MNVDIKTAPYGWHRHVCSCMCVAACFHKPIGVGAQLRPLSVHAARAVVQLTAPAVN